MTSVCERPADGNRSTKLLLRVFSPQKAWRKFTIHRSPVDVILSLEELWKKACKGSTVHKRVGESLLSIKGVC